MSRPPSWQDAYRDATRATEADVERQLARLRETPRRVPRWPLLAVGALAVAAGLFLVLQPPAELESRALASSGGWTEVLPGLSLQLDGEATLSGERSHPHVALMMGRLDIDLAPGTLAGLTIETREGRAEVLGTRFSVSRDPLGSHVQVDEGRVRVTCEHGGEVAVLPAGRSMLCWPTSAGGLLGRSRALQRQAAAPTAILETARRGLALIDESSSIQQELRFVRQQAAETAGLDDEALETALAYLAGPDGPRTVPMLTASARLADRLGRCDRVAEHAAALQDLRERNPDLPCESPPEP